MLKGDSVPCKKFRMHLRFLFNIQSLVSLAKFKG